MAAVPKAQNDTNMAFIEKTDLKLSILTDELTEITRGDDDVITMAIDSAIGEMRTYLYDSYDVETIFGASGEARNKMLVQLAVDITVFIIVGVCQAGQDLEDRKARYKRAITWLKEAQDTKTYSDLPRREVTEQTHFLFGSNSKRNNYY